MHRFNLFGRGASKVSPVDTVSLDLLVVCLSTKNCVATLHAAVRHLDSASSVPQCEFLRVIWCPLIGRFVCHYFVSVQNSNLQFWQERAMGASVPEYTPVNGRDVLLHGTLNLMIERSLVDFQNCELAGMDVMQLVQCKTISMTGSVRNGRDLPYTCAYKCIMIHVHPHMYSTYVLTYADIHLHTHILTGMHAHTGLHTCIYTHTYTYATHPLWTHYHLLGLSVCAFKFILIYIYIYFDTYIYTNI